MNIFDDTICAPATSVGSGAISLVRVSGPDAFEVVDKVVKFRRGSVASSAGYSTHFGTVSQRDGSLLDEVLATVFKAPCSYTGEDSVEISCHSSNYIVQQIIFQLIDAGARTAEPGEFTKRAFVNGKMDLAQCEAVADLIASGNAEAHRIAMNQLKGRFSNELQKMRAKLLKITALMELELDFSEEDIEFADRSEIHSLIEETLGMISSLAGTFRLGNAIKNGVPVAIAGPVNAGKSTLLNALVGDERAIVSDIPGTTRDSIEETMTIGTTLFRFIDTAGIRDASETIEKMGIERTYDRLSKADIILGIVDASADPDTSIADAKCLLKKVDTNWQQLIFVANKIDKTGVNKNVNNFNNFVSSFNIQGNKPLFVEISAKEGTNLENLRDMLVRSQQSRLESSAPGSGVLVSNARHYHSLKAAEKDLTQVLQSLDARISTELIAQDLRYALAHLGAITGEISTDEVLGEIFSNFCIGK